VKTKQIYSSILKNKFTYQYFLLKKLSEIRSIKLKMCDNQPQTIFIVRYIPGTINYEPSIFRKKEDAIVYAEKEAKFFKMKRYSDDDLLWFGKRNNSMKVEELKIN
jgi:hypothetical protein